VAGKPADQRGDALGGVGKLAGCPRRMQMRVECRFADVDADVLGYAGLHLFQVLCLSCGPKARVSVQATGKEKGDLTLARPITASCFTMRPFPAVGEFVTRRRRPLLAERSRIS